MCDENSLRVFFIINEKVEILSIFTLSSVKKVHRYSQIRVLIVPVKNLKTHSNFFLRHDFPFRPPPPRNLRPTSRLPRRLGSERPILLH